MSVLQPETPQTSKRSHSPLSDVEILVETPVLSKPFSYGPRKVLSRDENAVDEISSKPRRKLVKKADIKGLTNGKLFEKTYQETFLNDLDHVQVKSHISEDYDAHDEEFKPKRSKFVKKSEIQEIPDSNIDLRSTEVSLFDISSEETVKPARRKLIKKSLIGDDSAKNAQTSSISAVIVIESEAESELEEIETDAQTVSFFNSCTLEQLKDVGAKKDVANAILFHRPFENRQDLLEKVKKVSPLVTLLDSYRDIDRVIARCEAKGTELVKALEGIEGFPQPKCMNESIKLKKYQLTGVAWLSCLFQKRLGAILGDEMGTPIPQL